MEKLIFLREAMKIPFTLSSAYRCPGHNSSVNPKTGENGPHTTGKAVDIVMRGADAYRLIHYAMNAGFTGIGVKQAGIGRYLHLDILAAPDYPRPMIWSYSDK